MVAGEVQDGAISEVGVVGGLEIHAGGVGGGDASVVVGEVSADCVVGAGGIGCFVYGVGAGLKHGNGSGLVVQLSVHQVIQIVALPLDIIGIAD